MSIYCALLHHPVRDRAGQTTTTAVTTLDVHDIARTARTFEVRGYFVVTPVEPQRNLVERILSHWRDGAGVKRMPERRVALERCEVVPDLARACARITDETGQQPRLWATAATSPAVRPRLSHVEARRRLRAGGRPVLLLFGTGHGLAPELLAEADELLEPIAGLGAYNHLSVRSAAAILLDRLLGNRESGAPGESGNVDGPPGPC